MEENIYLERFASLMAELILKYAGEIDLDELEDVEIDLG